MQTLTEIRRLLEERGLSPRHRLGQNFLHDQNVVRKLVDASGVGDGDLVLEVGPGTGVLTEELVSRGCRVVACEVDEGLANLVEDRLGKRIVLVRGDCLGRRRMNDQIVDALGDEPWRLVANLPYQIATPLMVDIVMHHGGCQGQFVTIQSEVADRLRAAPGSSARGALSVLAQVRASIEVIGRVPPSCFWPRPKVTSACVAIRPVSEHSVDDIDGFASFVKRLFGGRRKQIRTILGRDASFPPDVPPVARPATLTIPQLLSTWHLNRGHPPI
ncbi:MAG: 16S rRNA (adenine(1518)-N(6)/adenine(1519)-N(6))-dimethyltransferase RsmA [Phycisphaerales bacterium]|nr:16S rRNA (adenine(1518)-N(6)/adenine(1519)-N(6))-dimethyltransferase RsmA [Phycisphaerales bacterium]